MNEVFNVQHRIPLLAVYSTDTAIVIVADVQNGDFVWHIYVLEPHQYLVNFILHCANTAKSCSYCHKISASNCSFLHQKCVQLISMHM